MYKIKSTGDYKVENIISISFLNDFIFCPVSIYFHNLYGETNTLLYQTKDQLNGKDAHKSVDEHTYTTRKTVMTGISVFSEKYMLTGKIDLYDAQSQTLTERKKKIKEIYDGYVFQLYAQYFCMKEMGYSINNLKLYSMDDNKGYPVLLPEENPEMLQKFLNTVQAIQDFDISVFVQENPSKCGRCIYEPACDRGKL